jgi:hypothetical protein
VIYICIWRFLFCLAHGQVANVARRNLGNISRVSFFLSSRSSLITSWPNTSRTPFLQFSSESDFVVPSNDHKAQKTNTTVTCTLLWETWQKAIHGRGLLPPQANSESLIRQHTAATRARQQRVTYRCHKSQATKGNRPLPHSAAYRCHYPAIPYSNIPGS